MTDQSDQTVAPQRSADITGLADTALRSALEFAVGIAAAGQKLRPPLEFPAAFKPYLKSKRLDAAALRAVRRALVSDEPFRDRLGLVDSSDLIGALGTTWLRRADGWEDEVGRLVAAALQEASEAKAEAALRKSEKRRVAAEQLAVRARAELIGHHDAQAREVKRRELAEERARIAVGHATALRDEVGGLQREVQRLRSKLEAESARVSRADAAAAALAGQLAEVQQVRDELLANRHEESDNAVPAALAGANTGDQAARALLQAAASTTELAAALAAAAAALDESSSSASVRSPGAGLPAVKPIRRPAERRRPIPVPGGLHGNTPAAAEHLLRVPNVSVIVDGYNLAKLAWPKSELIDQRECCIALLEDLARRFGTDIRVIFDGAEVVGASSRRRLIRVQFSPPGVIADDVIRTDVRSLPTRTPVVVVTNDQAIVNDVRALGANTVSTDTLLETAGRNKPVG